MPDTTVPTDRPPRHRPGLLVAPADVARYGAGGALVITALTAAGEPVTFGYLGDRTGLDPGSLVQALIELSGFNLAHACEDGWRLVDELAALRAHVEAVTAGSELEASNIPAVDQ